LENVVEVADPQNEAYGKWSVYMTYHPTRAGKVEIIVERQDRPLGAKGMRIFLDSFSTAS
jgi:hypothetical protein